MDQGTEVHRYMKCEEWKSIIDEFCVGEGGQWTYVNTLDTKS